MNRLQRFNSQQKPERLTLQLAQATTLLDEFLLFIYMKSLNIDDILAVYNATKNFYQKSLMSAICRSHLPRFYDPSPFHYGKKKILKYIPLLCKILLWVHTREENIGTGIGLAIFTRLIERYGGRIWVDSKPNKAATFFLNC